MKTILEGDTQQRQTKRERGRGIENKMERKERERAKRVKTNEQSKSLGGR